MNLIEIDKDKVSSNKEYLMLLEVHWKHFRWTISAIEESGFGLLVRYDNSLFNFDMVLKIYELPNDYR